MRYDPFNWYWLVGDKLSSGVFSSATGTYVPLDDATYVAWSAVNLTTNISSESELLDVLTQQAPNLVMQIPAGLIAYARRKQTTLALGAVAVDIGGGETVHAPLDAHSLGILNTAMTVAAANPSATTPWIDANNTTTTLNATQVGAIFTAVVEYIQATFATLKGVIDGINAQTITTRAQVDSPPSPIPPWPAGA